MSKQTNSANTPTPAEQIATATAALEKLQQDRAALLARREADDPLRQLNDAISAKQAELAAAQAAANAGVVRDLALALRDKVKAFTAEGDDLSSALADAAESGANLKALLLDIHRLQHEIGQKLGRDAPAFPTGKQLDVMVDIGFRSALQDSVFRQHVERLGPLDKRDIGAVTAGWGGRIEANWIAPFVGEEQAKTEAA